MYTAVTPKEKYFVMSLIIGQQLNRQIVLTIPATAFPNRVGIAIKNDVSQVLLVTGFVISATIVAPAVIGTAVGDSGFRFFCAKDQPEQLQELILFGGNNVPNIEFEYDSMLKGRLTTFKHDYAQPVRLSEPTRYVFGVELQPDTVTIPGITGTSLNLTIFGQQVPKQDLEQPFRFR